MSDSGEGRPSSGKRGGINNGEIQDDYDPSDNELRWSQKIPLVRNSILVRELAAALGAGVLVVAIIIFAASGDIPTAAYLSIGLFAGVFALAMVVVLALNLAYGGGLDSSFYIGPKGAGYELGKPSKRINRATLLASLMSRSPTVTGAQLISASRESGFIGWDEIRSITIHKKERVIYLRRKKLVDPVALFCSPENFGAAVALVSMHAPKVKIETR